LPPPIAPARILEILRAHGRHATSFQILETGYEYWIDEQAAAPGGLIAYVESGGYRVAAGPPVATPDDLVAVTRRFADATAACGLRALFFCADGEFVAALGADVDALAFDVVPIGEQPEWDPADWNPVGKRFRTLREQVNRARNKGVVIRSIPPEEMASASTRAEIETVLGQWQDGRPMSAMRFMVDLQPFHLPEERRYYVAECGGRAVGFLAAIPVFQRNGWFFEDVIRTPDAPNGTVEFLIHTAMFDAKERGDRYVTLGLAPLASIPVGEGTHRTLRRTLDWCYRRLGRLYQFEGLRSFKDRFRPDGWSQQYLVQVHSDVGVRSFHAVLRAFAGGGLFAFGLDTVKRALARIPVRLWAVSLFVLAALLIPWTILLALADGQTWFGDVSVQQAWVAFDAAMVGALSGLGWMVWTRRRASRTLAIFLAGATLTDFILTTVQAFNLHSGLSGFTQIFVLAGMIGPLLATGFLVALAQVAPLGRERPGGLPRSHRGAV
jgi:phosphatidylglycerol lysyltransferase